MSSPLLSVHHSTSGWKLLQFPLCDLNIIIPFFGLELSQRLCLPLCDLRVLFLYPPGVWKRRERGIWQITSRAETERKILRETIQVHESKIETPLQEQQTETTYADRRTYRQTDRKTDRHAFRQTDRRTDRQRNRQTERVRQLTERNNNRKILAI